MIRKTASWRDACDRVTSQKTAYYRPTTSRANTGVSDCTTNSAATAPCSKRDIVLIYHFLCQLGACLLVTSFSLVASCKKWTCPQDNHPRTFDMSGDILACLGHTDWHYFEPWFQDLLSYTTLMKCITIYTQTSTISTGPLARRLFVAVGPVTCNYYWPDGPQRFFFS